MTLQETIRAIGPFDEAAAARARRRWNSLAKPLGSLGQLEEAVIQIAGITGSERVRLKKRAVVVMCADNGVVEEGVTQCDNSVTAIVTENFTTGTTSVCCMARAAGADVVPVDIGVAREVDGPGLIHHKLAFGTDNMTKGPAMTREQAVEAVETGINIAMGLANEGYCILATGEMGIGNTTTSSAVASVFLGRSPAEVTGRGAGLSSEGLERKIRAIERAVAVNRPDPEDAVDVLAKVGGFDLAGLAGVFLGGAAARVPVLVDGFIWAAAALAAVRICPAVRPYLIASHVSKEPAGRMLMRELELSPFLDAGMCLGEGTGAVAALSVLDMALAVYDEMATFTETSIEEYQPLV